MAAASSSSAVSRVALVLLAVIAAGAALYWLADILTPLASAVICTRAYHHGEAVDRIAGIVNSRLGDRPQWIAPTIEDAARLSREIATAHKMTVLVAGGLFLAVEFAVAWKGQNPQELKFL